MSEVADAGVTAPAEVTAPKPGSPEYNAAMIAKARGSRITENSDQRTVGADVADGATATTETVAPATATTETTQAATATATPSTENAAATAVAKPPVKPEGVPEKFWNATTGAVDYAAWNKSTTELEAHFTRSRQAEAAAKKVNDAKAAVAAATTPEAKTAAESALTLATAEQLVASQTPAPAPQAETPAAKPVTFEQAQAAATQEFAQSGKLSDASYQQFEKLGIPKVAVDAHIAGLQAQTATYVGQIHQSAGGKEAYDAMVNWAKVNYTPAEAAAFDQTLRSMDAGQMTMAVNGLKARFTAANGTGGTLLTPNPGGGVTGEGIFSSQAEMTTAMRDPRYQKDAAYRAEVARKVSNSKRQGIHLGYSTQQSGPM